MDWESSTGIYRLPRVRKMASGSRCTTQEAQCGTLTIERGGMGEGKEPQ